MKKTYEAQRRSIRAAYRDNLLTGMAWGLTGGFAGTLAMDLTLMGGLWTAGLPAFTCFRMVGDTAAQFFGLLGLEIGGGVPAGVAAHYLIGPLVGLVFGAWVTQKRAEQIGSLRKGLLLAIIYVELLSQPLLATTPVLLNLDATYTLQWFGLSFVMHLLFALVLAVVFSSGMTCSRLTNPKEFHENPLQP